MMYPIGSYKNTRSERDQKIKGMSLVSIQVRFSPTFQQWYLKAFHYVSPNPKTEPNLLLESILKARKRCQFD